MTEGLDVTIRPARPEDADGIGKVHVDVWRTTYRGIVPDQFLNDLKYEVRANSHRNRLSKVDPKQCFFVAEIGKKIVGFSCAGPGRDGREGYDGELYAIYLFDEYHGRGIGRRLFLVAKEWLKANGYRAMFLWVLKDNPTRKFYESMGGVELDSKVIEIGAPLDEVSYGWPDLKKLCKFGNDE